MEILAGLNYAELGVAGVFIAYLIWTIQTLKKENAEGRLREDALQERCFSTVSDSFNKVSDALNTIEKAILLSERR